MQSSSILFFALMQCRAFVQTSLWRPNHLFVVCPWLYFFLLRSVHFSSVLRIVYNREYKRRREWVLRFVIGFIVNHKIRVSLWNSMQLPLSSNRVSAGIQWQLNNTFPSFVRNVALGQIFVIQRDAPAFFDHTFKFVLAIFFYTSRFLWVSEFNCCKLQSDGIYIQWREIWL